MKKKTMLIAIISIVAILTTLGYKAFIAKKITTAFDLGTRYLSEAKYEEAVIEFNKVIKIDSEHAEAIKKIDLINLYTEIEELCTNKKYEDAENLLIKLNEHEYASHIKNGLEKLKKTIDEGILQMTVDIPDAELKKYILEALNKDSDHEITRADMLSLTKLDIGNPVSGSKVKSLEGLHYALNLNRLSAIGQISDITPVKYLINLKELHIMYGSLEDLSPLSNLTTLETLSLDCNHIEDIRALANLTNLKSLSLSRNNIEDISAIQNLNNLEYLSFYDNNISDISPISSLTNLPYVSFQDNKIEDLTPLQELSNLNSIVLSGNNISNITPLLNLHNLKKLSVSNNNISYTDVNKLKSELSNTTIYADNNQPNPVSVIYGEWRIESSGKYIKNVTIDENTIDGKKYTATLKSEDYIYIELEGGGKRSFVISNNGTTLREYSYNPANGSYTDPFGTHYYKID